MGTKYTIKSEHTTPPVNTAHSHSRLTLSLSGLASGLEVNFGLNIFYAWQNMTKDWADQKSFICMFHSKANKMYVGVNQLTFASLEGHARPTHLLELIYWKEKSNKGNHKYNTSAT